MKTLSYQIAICMVVLSLVFGPVAPAFAQEGTPQAPTAITETETPTETPVVTETSTPQPVVETPTIMPSATVTTTVIPEAVAPEFVLTLSSNPNFLNMTGKVKLTWEIQGDLSKKNDLVLQISLPEGFTADLKKGDGTFDEKTRLLTVPVTKNKGEVDLEASEVKNNSYFTASLQSGEETLAQAEYFLPSKEEFKVLNGGDSITALDGKLKVTIPADTFGEDVTIAIGAPSSESMPLTSLSGKPFEITAVGEATQDVNGNVSRASFHEFENGNQVQFEIQYEDYIDVPEGMEGSLHVWWYNTETQEWEAINSVADPETKTITAVSDHFSLFDIGLNSWNASRVPSVDAFQVSEFTGAGSYSLPIEVPAGPGGFQPSLSLNYNSQVVDGSSLGTQASWVGMGWSMDVGSIDIDYRGAGNTSYILSVGGVSSHVFKDTNGKFHLADENGWDVQLLGTAPYSYWLVKDTQGNTYKFDYQVTAPINGCATQQERGWYLSEQTNKYGQTITYQYDNTEKKIVACGPNLGHVTPSTAVYLKTIRYNGYQVRFARNPIGSPRSDYSSADETDQAFHTYMKTYLQTIYVEQDTSGNGSFSSVNPIRSYGLEYNTGDKIWPQYTYTAGGQVLTLNKVHEYGTNGSQLQTTTFEYADAMHMSKVSNSYGGSVSFNYSPWVSPLTSRVQNYYQQYDENGDQTNSVCYAPWQGWTGSGFGGISCGGNLLSVGSGSLALTSGSGIHPGGAYRVSAQIYAYASDQARLGVRYTPLSIANQTYGDIYYGPYVNGSYTGGTWPPTPVLITYTSPILPINQTKASDVLIQASGGSVKVPWFRAESLPTYYRVSSKTVSDAPSGLSPHQYTTSYAYEVPSMNPADTYQAPQYAEFRGHWKVTATHADGTKTVTTYHQTDDLKGRPSQISQYDAANKLVSRQDLNYSVTNLPISSSYFLVSSVVKALPTRAFTYTSSETQTAYNTNSTPVGSTSTQYFYNPNYQLSQQKEYDNGDLYRMTHYEYFVNLAKNITALPAHQWVTDAGGTTLAETLYLYDGSNTYNTAPTDGKLTAQRTLVSGNQYAQTTYVNDAWGNQTSVTTYTGTDGTAASAPTTGAATTSTVYDGTYHTYPVTITNALNQATTITYDYTKGVPLTATDPNGATVRAEYDAFGRIIKIFRPDPATGTEASSASLTMAYTSSYPFTTTITQTNPSYTIIKKYDGMGRATQVNAGGIVTDTLYDSATVTRQSMPYPSGDTVHYFTTTTVNPSTRTTTTAAPDGTTTVSASNGLTSTVTDALGHSTSSTNDIWGRATLVVPPTGPSLGYSYDPLGNLLQVTHGTTSTPLPDTNSPGTTALAAWWSMNETSGTRNDSHGTSHLTDVNTVLFAPGVNGSSASFVTANQERFTVADNAAISGGDVDFTLIAHVYFNTLNDHQMIMEKGASSGLDYRLIYNKDVSKLRFRVGSDSAPVSVDSNTSVQVNTWYTIFAWHDASSDTINIQVNNGVVNTQSFSGGTTNSTNLLSIGAAADSGISYAVNGRVDEAAIYKRKLNAAERTWLYNNGAGRAYSEIAPVNPGTNGLSAWWTLNEASGTRNDSSTSAQHLSDNNTVASQTGKVSNAADLEKNTLEYFSRPSSNQLRMGSGNIYVSAWIKAEDLMVSYPHVLAKRDASTTNSEYQLRVNASNPSNKTVDFIVWGTTGNYTTATSSVPITEGQWYFVEGWTDKANNTAYVNINNGTPGSATWPANENRDGAGTASLLVGARDNNGIGEYWDGLIDEVVFYKRMLSPTERSWLYNNGSGRTYSALTQPAAPSPIVTTLTYNKAGQKLTMSDPDMGNWSYTYDGMGNLTRQTDARGQRICMYYDVLNRVTGKHYRTDNNCPVNPSSSTLDASYQYDSGLNGIGHRTSMTSGPAGPSQIADSWTYDKRGRMTTATNQGLTTTYTYTNADMPLTMQYPDGEIVTHTYDARMLLTTLSGMHNSVPTNYVTSTSYDSAGRVTERALGNGLSPDYTYYLWNEQATGIGQGGRLKTLTTGSLQNLLYQYDKVGNIKSVADSIASETSTYNYDTLDRLTSWTLGSTTENYGYNTTTGNLENKAGTTLNYADTAHKHAATSAGGNTFTYDANGNQITRVIGADAFNLVYDAENRIVEVKKNSTSIAAFAYDADGKRVQATENGTLTKFIGGHYEVTGSEITKHYFAGASRIATRKYTVPSSMSLEYVLSDHLGSSTVNTDDTGAKVSEMRYKPWGEVRYSWKASASHSLADYTFTGQYSYMDDPSTSGVTEGFGLMFYNARWYDPSLGRFAQADSIVPAGVQGWDRYAYVNNNPVKYTDPSGHRPTCDQDGNCKQVTLADQISAYKNMIKDKFDWNIQGNWTLKDLKTIYQTGNDIQNYVDGLTDGKGNAWMRTYLGGTTIMRWDGKNYQTLPSWLVSGGSNVIKINGGDLSGRWLSHEFGHIWDINTGSSIPCACGITGGVADELNQLIGGYVSYNRAFDRFTNSYGKSASAFIPENAMYAGITYDVRFKNSVANGYGNGSTADYLAESFSWNVNNKANVPLVASVLVDNIIISQSQTLP